MTAKTLIPLLVVPIGFAGAGRAAGPRPAASEQHTAVTFARNVAPIIWSECATCHRPGQGAPFSLVTYEDVRPRAREIMRAVTNRSMPPWKPEPGYGEFEHARRLDPEQLATLQQWADDGFLRGEAAELPPAPKWTTDWQLGQPDLVITMPEPYVLPARGPDVFRTFVVPIPGATRRHVKAIEFHPGSFAAMHHANIKIDETRLSRRLDDEEAGPGYEGAGSREARFPDGTFLGWTPGQSPRVSPDDMAWTLEPASDLVIEAHLMPTGHPERVQISVGLYFTATPPSRTPYMLRLGRQDIDIAPGQRDYVNSDSFTLPVDIDVLAVQPHAHYLAKEVRASATLPDGTIRWLIFIRDWDFRWQDIYRYAEPLSLPKGTVLTMRYTYDNSAANARNPNHPPKRVTYGQTTSSEMGSLWVQVLPHSKSDLKILDSQFAPKLLADDIAGYQKALEVNQRDPRVHATLASGYVEADRLTDAIAEFGEALRLDPTAPRQYDVGAVLLQAQKFGQAADHFAEAARLKPEYAEAFYGLGVARQGEGRLDDAIDSYRRALQLDLHYADAYYNLGRALATQGRTADAISEYQRGLELKPDDAEAHQSLAAVLASQDRIDEAIAHYRRALQLSPDLPGALVDLAWLLATSDQAGIRNPSEAVRLAERAADLTNHLNASVLDTLSVAYAAAGQIVRAITTAEAAIGLATRSGDNDLARRIRQRLDFYRQREH